MSKVNAAPLRRPAWVVALATTLTLAYLTTSTLLVVSLALHRDPTGAPDALLYGGAFVLMLACAPVTPSRGSGSRDTHLHRAPVWLKALVVAHAAGFVVVLGLVVTGMDVPAWAPSLVLATFFGAVGVLMGWFGQFTPPGKRGATP